MSENNHNTKMIVEQLENLNKILSCFLVIAIKDSTLKTMSPTEIQKVMPIVNNTLKAINESINNE
jgi:hypothetical protein|tara:strand:- start:56 stop:250 length:195 start_codon:yes stop_codon:yes gene_type:complete